MEKLKTMEEKLIKGTVSVVDLMTTLFILYLLHIMPSCVIRWGGDIEGQQAGSSVAPR